MTGFIAGRQDLRVWGIGFRVKSGTAKPQIPHPPPPPMVWSGEGGGGGGGGPKQAASKKQEPNTAAFQKPQLERQ